MTTQPINIVTAKPPENCLYLSVDVSEAELGLGRACIEIHHNILVLFVGQLFVCPFIPDCINLEFTLHMFC